MIEEATMARLTAVAMIVALIVCSCCDQCPISETGDWEPDYHFTYSYVGSETGSTFVLTYSSKTGEVIDSMPCGSTPFSDMAFSSAGEYVCYTSILNLDIGTAETWVERTSTGDTIAYLSGIGTRGCLISPDDQHVLLFGGHTLAILTLPNLSTYYMDTLHSHGALFHPYEEKVFMCLNRAMDSLFVMDYSSIPVIFSSIPVEDENGRLLLTKGPLMVTEDYLFLNPYEKFPSVGYYFHVYEVETLEPVSKLHTNLPTVYRGRDLHPDGKRLFLSYNGGSELPWISGVHVYNLVTGSLLPYISQSEIADSYHQIAPTDLVFFPEGESFLLLDGGTGFWLGPLLEINTSTKEVIRRWAHSDGVSWFVRLNPKDWSK
jgi:hypothetical protein